jgi:hypothetical protein
MRAAQLSSASLLIAAASVCLGCQQAGPKTDHYVVKSAKSEFYKYGPAQANGADLAIQRGTAVTMVRRDFGFSQIRLEDGTIGYVATDDLKAAPPPPATPRPRGASQRRVASKSSNVKPIPGDPLFDINDVPAVLPSDPEPKPPKP